MDASSQPKNNGLKITLSIAFVVTLIALIFFGLCALKEEKNKETFRCLGGCCLVIGSILLFLSAVQYVFTGHKNKVEYLSQAPQAPPPAPTNKGTKTLLIISADSWCGYSQKMTKEVPSLKAVLEPMGVEVVLVSDIPDKAAFQKLAAEHSARGFPHSVLLVEGTKIADIPG